MENSTICYWNSGGFYFEMDPMTHYKTEAAMFRRADEMGFTHVTVKHGYYKVGDGFVEDITGIKRRVPKKYRQRQY